MMPADAQAIDMVLARGSNRFADMVRGHTVVQMGTVGQAYSERPAEEIAAVGGRYSRVPVSGSRGPAEKGRLVSARRPS